VTENCPHNLACVQDYAVLLPVLGNMNQSQSNQSMLISPHSLLCLQEGCAVSLSVLSNMNQSQINWFSSWAVSD
jgi:hypothetical protein